ncbi:hypothetical protein NFI96_009242 [Prochilodus magdalenae]|nr:hypothetical protein NFI96_009242 [Prochilodus magdalenae]
MDYSLDLYTYRVSCMVSGADKMESYYTCVEVIFTLRRQVGFYMMGVYAPTLLIVVLSWLSFWINPDASAARVPLGILSVLSLSSECTSLASELPKVSYVKAIDIWLIACLLFGFASLVEYAVVQVILNSPKLVEAEKARMATREKAEGKTPAKINTLNGTGGTPLHVSTLQAATVAAGSRSGMTDRRNERSNALYTSAIGPKLTPEGGPGTRRVSNTGWNSSSEPLLHINTQPRTERHPQLFQKRGEENGLFTCTWINPSKPDLASCIHRLSWSDSEWQRVIFSDESSFSLGGDAQRIRVWRHRGQHQDEWFVVTRPEDLVSLHLHPYRTICRNCVRMFKLHGMDYHRTPLGTSTAPYRDVWRVGLANTAARRHTERQTSVTETRCKKVCTSKSDLRSNDFSIVGSLPRDFELSNFDCYGKPIDVGSALGKSQAKNNKKPPPPKPVIPSAAKRIDLYSRALFPFSFLFFNIIYWSVYL